MGISCVIDISIVISQTGEIVADLRVILLVVNMLCKIIANSCFLFLRSIGKKQAKIVANLTKFLLVVR